MYRGDTFHEGQPLRDFSIIIAPASHHLAAAALQALHQIALAQDLKINFPHPVKNNFQVFAFFSRSSRKNPDSMAEHSSLSTPV